jgi:hypothetical protein
VVAGPVLGEGHLRLAFGGHDQGALAVAQSQLHGVVEALALAGLGDQPVHHRVDRVLLLLVEPDVVVERQHDPVHPHPREARLAHRVEHVPMLALALLDQGGQDQELGARRQLLDLVDDLLRRLLGHRAAAVVAGEPPDPGPQHAQVVVDLGDRAHRGAGVAARRLLLDRDRGREPADRVVEGLVHLPQELAGVGIQALDVAALPLGVEGVEGQARFSRARDPGQDHQLLLGDLDRDVLEVVLPGAGNDDPIEFHGRRVLVPRAGETSMLDQKRPGGRD